MKQALIALVILATVLFLSANAFSQGLKGDFDLDGDVDADDLAVFSENFGKTAGICMDSDNCLAAYYCEKEIGDCHGDGVCTEKPIGCYDI